jgi:hypothetical protein
MTSTSTNRILIVANETVESPLLREAILLGTDTLGATEVSIVAPALNARVRHWASDEDAAREAAELRLAHCVNQLADDGIYAEGWVGDADPLQAIADALRHGSVDLLIVATRPEGASNWLEHRLVDRARHRFDLPLMHVIVDSARAIDMTVRAAA